MNMPMKTLINIRRDLLEFIDYVQSYGIKRSHRGNEIPKTDIKRLEKRLNVPEYLNDTEDGKVVWIDWISWLALSLKLVSYDIKGVYAGHSSQEPSFPDNYIKTCTADIEQYLRISSADKEFKILEVLLTKTPNEFYDAWLFGTQGRFSTSGRGINGASKMDLPLIRKSLLKILSTFPIDTPISFHSFVERVHKESPDLILKQGTAKQPKYYCFYEKIYSTAVKAEALGRWENGSTEKEVDGKDSDAFTRVEGRYLAYFLEAIAVPMLYVNLEYDEEFLNGLHDRTPMLPCFIKSFTLTKKFKTMQSQDILTLNYVKTTVTPDFKIFVEATLYPDKQLRQLEPYTQILVEDKYTTTLELSRKKTIQSLADNPSLQQPLDILNLLVTNIPKNVAADISEWTSQADKFIVYEGFGVLEIDKTAQDIPEGIRHTIKERIADNKISNIFLIANESSLFNLLEDAGLVPEKVNHSKNQINADKIKCSHRLSKGSKAQPVEKKSKQIEKVQINETAFIALKSENPIFFKKMKKAFEEMGVIPIQPDTKVGICFVPDKARPKLVTIIKNLSTEFQVEFL